MEDADKSLQKAMRENEKAQKEWRFAKDKMAQEMLDPANKMPSTIVGKAKDADEKLKSAQTNLNKATDKIVKEMIKAGADTLTHGRSLDRTPSGRMIMRSPTIKKGKEPKSP